VRRGHPAAPAWSFVPAIRSAIGVAALWATFCVVLLAAGWLSGGQTDARPGPASHALALLADAADSRSGPALPAPAPEAPAGEPSVLEAGADPESSPDAVSPRLRRSAWVAVVPRWPAGALAWQRMEPALRLNPGHAPPRA
jgi:hypothetical protein